MFHLFLPWPRRVVSRVNSLASYTQICDPSPSPSPTPSSSPPPHSLLSSDSTCLFLSPSFPCSHTPSSCFTFPRDAGLIPGLGRSPGKGHGNPLQYSCLENPMDRGAWQATVPGVAKSQTRLKWLSSHTRYLCWCGIMTMTQRPWHLHLWLLSVSLFLLHLTLPPSGSGLQNQRQDTEAWRINYWTFLLGTWIPHVESSPSLILLQTPI